MGVDYRACIVVGLPYEDLPSQVQQLIEDETLKSISPYFDAPVDDCLIGYIVEETDDYSAKELSLDLSVKTEALAITFKLITGLDPKIYLSPYGR